MTVEQIIELANKRTERRGEKTLDLPAELMGVIQDLCGRKRWYWRRFAVNLTLAVGTTQYDISNPQNGDVSDLERICEPGPSYQYQNGVCTIHPAFAVHEQEYYAQDTQTNPGPPQKYWIQGTDQTTFNIWPSPDSAYTVRIPYWSMPTMDNPSQLSGVVPTVPERLHRLLVKGLEAQINRYTLGEDAGKYQAASGEFEAGIKRETMNTDFASGNVKEYTLRDHHAVRSTEMDGYGWRY